MCQIDTIFFAKKSRSIWRKVRLKIHDRRLFLFFISLTEMKNKISLHVRFSDEKFRKKTALPLTKNPRKSVYKVGVIRVPILRKRPLQEDRNTDDADFVHGFTRIFYP